MMQVCRGDKFPFLITILEGGDAMEIDAASDVTAVIVNQESQQIGATLTCTDADTDADWENGVVAAKFLSADTEGLELGLSILQVKVVDPDDNEPERWQYRLLEIIEGY